MKHVMAVLVLSSFCDAATVSVPGDYQTIQQAINAAANGDVVLVAPGEYLIARPLDYKGKAITIESVSGPEETKILMSENPDNPDQERGHWPELLSRRHG